MRMEKKQTRRRSAMRRSERKKQNNALFIYIARIKESIAKTFARLQRDGEEVAAEEKKYNRRRERKNKNDADRVEPDERTSDEADVEKDEEIEIRSLWQSKWMRAFIIFGAAFVLALIAYTSILYGGKLFVDEDELIISPPTTIETADGEIIWYIYEEFRLPVPLESIPEHVQKAFIAIEDRRFYTHTGVDLRSIMRAVWRDIIARDKVEGGSTITQQLAKNLFLTNDKSWTRKIKEAMIALHLEREFTKEQILEMYLNVIYFGQGQYGLEAAANRFFHKSVEELTLEEGALLAGIIKAPNGYSPINHPEKALERRNLVLETMAELGYITEEEMEAAKAKGLNLNLSQRKVNPAHHTIVDLAIKEAEQKYGITLDELRKKRYRIVVSLDEEIQEIVYDHFQFDGYFPGNNKQTVEGAFVMIDEKTGRIVAAQGGRKYERGNLNRVVEKRQPGSTFKPLAVYAPALESGEFTAFSLLPDELTEWDGHQVRNHDDRYEGQVTLYDALVKSKNTSSTWLLNEIGISYSKRYLEKMGIDIEDNSLSIALGGLKHGVSPLELVEGYRAFVHGGETIEAHTILEIYDNKNQLVASARPETKEVFSDQVAWDMTEMLKGVVENGTGKVGYYPYEMAGKTGSTQHPHKEGATKDAWFVGFTPDYVFSVWIGYDVSDENQYLTGGSSYPTQLAKKIMTEVAKQKDVQQAFKLPEGVKTLSEPVELPEINDLIGSYTFGGFKILKGKLQWTGSNDRRVIYKIYEKNDDEIKLLDEVVGETEYVIDQFMLFKHRSYFVVPVDPFSGQEGKTSNIVSLP